MRTIQRSILLGLSLSLLVPGGVRVWAAPASPAAALQTDRQEPNKDQSSSQTFSGTIVRKGDSFVLRETSGSVYQLDDTARAQQFEGKNVKVTGHLDTEAKVIHVESIEALDA